jgi:hypothetical protein
MVSVSYFAFWVMDLKKKRGEVRKLLVREEKAFAGELAVALQSINKLSPSLASYSEDKSPLVLLSRLYLLSFAILNPAD